MTDIALVVSADAVNPVAHDLRLDDVTLVLTSGQAESVAQHLRIRMQFFLGEWFLNLREGVPFYRDILVKNPSTQTVRAIFRRVVLSTPGVEALTAFDLRLDKAARSLDLAFSARLSGGEILAAEFGDFVIKVVS